MEKGGSIKSVSSETLQKERRFGVLDSSEIGAT